MKILIVHNAYIHPGGEDVCVQNEITALEEAGQQILVSCIQSEPGLAGRRRALLAPIGRGWEGRVESLLQRERPNILHVHNLTPLLSPRLFECAQRLGTAVVQTLHNFRPLCLNGLFLTPAKEVCERCTPGHYGPGVLRGCYRRSRLQSLGLALHLGWMTRHGAYEKVDRYIAPSEFLKSKFVAKGFPENKITVQGHFVPTSRVEPLSPEPYVLYMGRLSEEKGVRWLAQQFHNPALPLRLKIAGEGPLLSWLQKNPSSHIELVGYIRGEVKNDLVRRAAALIMPSDCYENFPLAIAEVNQEGISALVPAWGGLQEMVKPGVNGAHYTPRDAPSFWKALKSLTLPDSSLERRRRCQSHAAELFSKSRFIATRMKLYESLL